MPVTPPYSLDELRTLLDQHVSIKTAMGTGFGTLRAVDENSVTLTLEWSLGDLHDTLSIEDIEEIKLYEAG